MNCSTPHPVASARTAPTETPRDGPPSHLRCRSGLAVGASGRQIDLCRGRCAHIGGEGAAICDKPVPRCHTFPLGETAGAAAATRWCRAQLSATFAGIDKPLHLLDRPESVSVPTDVSPRHSADRQIDRNRACCVGIDRPVAARAAATKQVVARAADQLVVRAAVELVIAGAAVEHIIAVETVDGVGTGCRRDYHCQWCR